MLGYLFYLQTKGGLVDQNLRHAGAAGQLPSLRVRDALEVLLHVHFAARQQRAVELDDDLRAFHGAAGERRARDGAGLRIGQDGGALRQANAHLLLRAGVNRPHVKPSGIAGVAVAAAPSVRIRVMAVADGQVEVVVAAPRLVAAVPDLVSLQL